MPSKLVLLIDDEADVRSALRDVLEDAGYSIVEAPDSRRALHYLTTDDPPVPSVILTDLNLRETNGLELARVLKTYSSVAHVPIIITSALPLRSSELPEDVAAYLEKPIAIPVLLKTIEDALALVT